MHSRKELNYRPALDFLEPQNFSTLFDVTGSSKLKEQYEKGLSISRESRVVGISIDGTWWAKGIDGSMTNAYEVVGYHVGTCEIIHGFLDGPAQFIVYRLVNGKIESAIVKESSR